MTNSPLEFHKIQGAGNDFIALFLELPSVREFFQGAHRTLGILKLCDRHFGIGADGLIFIEALAGHQDRFRWHFYNRDGSAAEMCGNAARAVTELLLVKTHGEQITVETAESQFVGFRQRDQIVVEFAMQMRAQALKIPTHVGEIQGHLIHAGVPHFIPERTLDWKIEKSGPILKELRHAPAAGPAGTNVTLISSGTRGTQAITYERGVEGFTHACGTGAIAAAYLVMMNTQERKTEIKMPGGLLTVEFMNDQRVRLIGQAARVFSGQIDEGSR